MSASLRHLFACFLLVLLPFQAVAAGFSAGKAPVISCPAAMMGDSDCCGDGGCTPDACMAAVAAVLPATPMVVPRLAVTVFTHDEATVKHPSYIPDRPQRPPQHLN